jgi:hypothetical protein
VAVDADVLTLGVPLADTLPQGVSRYYKFNAVAGQTIRLSLDAVSTGASHELFVRFGQMPSRGVFDLAYDEPFAPDQTLDIPITQTGTYYVLAYSAQQVGSPNVTVLARALPFLIQSVQPATAGNSGQVTLKIRGALFSADTQFQVLISPTMVLPASRVLFKNSTTVYATFDLTGIAAATYDLRAIKGDEVADLAHALTVVAGSGPRIQVRLNGPLTVRPGRANTLAVEYGNVGDGDTMAPLIIVENPNGVQVGMSPTALATSNLFLLGTSNDGPIDVARPGSLNSTSLFWQSPGAGQPVQLRAKSTLADDTRIVSSLEWSQIEASVRPIGMADSQWVPFWLNIRPRLGLTWGDFVQRLNQLAARFSPAGRPLQDVRAIFQAYYDSEPGFLPVVSYTGRLLDAADGSPLANVEVAAYRYLEDGSNTRYEASALTNAQGYFTFLLRDGEYDLAIGRNTATDQFMGFDMDQDGEQDFAPPSFTITGGADLTGALFYAIPEASVTDLTYDDAPRTVIDGTGVPHIVWARGREIWHAWHDGTGWVGAQPIPGAAGTDFSVYASGNLLAGAPGIVVTWTNRGSADNGSEIMYSVISPAVGGGYQISDPVQLTDNAIADATPAVHVTDDGQVLVVYTRTDDTIQDDTDLYYDKFLVDPDGLVYSAADILAAMAAGELDPAAQHTFEVGFKFAGPSWGFLKRLVDLKAEIKVNGSFDRACVLSLSAGGSLQLEFKSAVSNTQTFAGQGSYSGTWKAFGKKGECEYKFQSASLSGSVTGGIEFGVEIEWFTRFLPPVVGLPATLILAVARKLNVFAGDVGIEVKGTIGGSINWNKPDAPPVQYRWPDSGSITADFSVGPFAKIYGSMLWTSWQIKIYGRVGVNAEVYPNPKVNNVYGVLGVDIQLPYGVLTSYSVQANDLLGLSADYAALDGGGGGAVGDPTVTYDPSLYIGTGTVYGGNAVFAGTVGSDLYDDRSPVIARAPDGTPWMTWSKMQADGSTRILVSSYNGTTWSDPVMIPGAVGNAANPRILFDSAGRAVVAFSMSDTTGFDPATSPIEDLIAILESTDIYYSTFTAGAWTPAAPIATLAGMDDAVALGLAPDGSIVAAWINTDAGGLGAVQYSRLGPAGWSLPAVLSSGDAFGRPAITTVNGQTTVLYTIDTDASAERTVGKLYSTSFNGATWSAPVVFEPALSPEAEFLARGADGSVNVTTLADPGAINPSGAPFGLTPPEECCKCDEIKKITQGSGNCVLEVIYDEENCQEITVYKPCVVQPTDPNDIIGPVGYGEENWINNNTPLGYMIRFENKAETSGPAHEVFITQTLDSDLNAKSFRVGNFGIGDKVFEVPAGKSFYQTRIDLTETRGVFVDVIVNVNTSTNTISWNFISIDPATGQPPEDASLGFLPPNVNSPEGEAFVTYTVRPVTGVTTGTVIDAMATIIFDTEPPLDTPPIFNTLDVGKPQSTVAVQPPDPLGDPTSFVVTWSGDDDEGGSGIAVYNIFVSVNGGGWLLWLPETTNTQATYLGAPGATYAFMSVARGQSRGSGRDARCHDHPRRRHRHHRRLRLARHQWQRRPGCRRDGSERCHGQALHGRQHRGGFHHHGGRRLLPLRGPRSRAQLLSPVRRPCRVRLQPRRSGHR